MIEKIALSQVALACGGVVIGEVLHVNIPRINPYP